MDDQRGPLSLASREAPPAPPATRTAGRAAACRLIESAERQPTYLLSCANGAQLKLSASAYHLLASVEEGASFDEIAAALSARRGEAVAADEVAAAYQRLVDRIAEVESRPVVEPAGFWLRVPIMPARLVGRLAALLSGAYQPGLAALLLVGVIVTLGAVLRSGIELQFSADAYWTGYLLFVLSLIGHEIGHASACARYGARPSRIGLAAYWIYPVFYSDVSTAWQLKRWQRVVVDLGGAYFQAIVAGSFALLYLLTAWPTLKVAVLMIVYSAVFLLNPILKFDGYWLVADALGVTNLSQQPERIARAIVAHLRGQAAPPLPWSRRTTSLLVLYALATTGFWIVFGWQLLPFLWTTALGYPHRVAALATQLAIPPHHLPLEEVLGWLLATYLLLMVWALGRRLAKSLMLRTARP